VTSPIDALNQGFRTRYLDHEELSAQLRAWADALPDLVRLESIGESGEGREIWLLTLGREPDRVRPAAWVDGNMHASELCGTSAALQVAEDILRLHLSDDATGPIAEAVRASLVYVLPRMSPDGAEAVLRQGHFVRSVPTADPVASNAARWVPRDLDGDGLSLWMRVEDPTGEYVEAPDAPGLLVPRALDDEGPFYKLYPEGVIERFDGVSVPTPSVFDGGTPDLNRNFPFQWAPDPQQVGGGTHPVATPEVRAVVEWAARHPEVFVWLNLHTFGGVFIRPLGDAPDSKFHPEDRAVWRQLGAWAEETTGYPMVSGFEEFTYDPDTPLHGTLSEWAWAHRGAWAHVCELWDLFVQLGLERPKRFVEYYSRLSRADFARMAKWDAEENHGRMVKPWVPVEHPQLGRVEVGGFDPRVGFWNPPPERLAEVVTNLSRYFQRTVAILPRLAAEAAVTELAGDLSRVDLVVENRGYLSTRGPSPAADQPFAEPPWASAHPEGDLALSSETDARVQLRHLDGWGRGLYGGAETIFFMRSRGSTSRAHARWHVRGRGVLNIRVTSPRVGATELRLRV
jgi:hypothetical protein